MQNEQIEPVLHRSKDVTDGLLRINEQHTLPKESLFDERIDLKGKHIVIVGNDRGITNTLGTHITQWKLGDYVSANGGLCTYVFPSDSDDTVFQSDHIRCVTHKGIHVPGVEKHISLPNPKSVSSSLFGATHCIVSNPTTLGLEYALMASAMNIPTSCLFETRIAAYMNAELFKNQPQIGYAIERTIVDIYKRIHGDFYVHSASFAEYLQNNYGFHSQVASRQGQFSIPNHELDEEISNLKRIIAPNGELILSFVGKISDVKNLPFLMSIIDILNSREARVKLLVVGSNTCEKELNSHIQAFSQRDNVIFVGHQKGPSLECCYRVADLFVFPSTSETLGFVGIEALSLGVPLLASDGIGTRELVSHGINGYTIRTQSPHDALIWADVIQIIDQSRDASENRYWLDYLKANASYPTYIAQPWVNFCYQILREKKRVPTLPSPPWFFTSKGANDKEY